MATVKTFDKTNLKTIRADLEKALEAVSKKHGITLDFNNISFDSKSFSTRLKAEVKSTGTAAKVDPALEGVNPTWIKSFTARAVWVGLNASDLGKPVKLAGGAVGTLVGMRPKANAPMVVRKPTGGLIAVSVESVKAGLRLQATA
jgi:hypothetical protein